MFEEQVLRKLKQKTNKLKKKPITPLQNLTSSRKTRFLPHRYSLGASYTILHNKGKHEVDFYKK